MKSTKEQYQNTLKYLFSQLPMFQRVGAMAFKKDLSNIKALCAAFNSPHLQFKSIHIAGTNGKGSTAHMLAAVFQSCGYKCGLYTSPHYKDFRERIKINGQLISEQEVVDFVTQHQQLFEEIKPSFFEITVAMAFQHFANEKVDIAIIETGLGGRLDSTNIITPLLSLITNIGLDHQQFLGETLPEIAAEKAGIIKPKVPVVVGERQTETAAVFERFAAMQNTPIYFAEDNITVSVVGQTDEVNIYEVVAGGAILYRSLEVSAKGPYQHKNLALVIQTILVLSNDILDHPLKEEGIRNGLSNLQSLVKYQGRWQWLSKKPRVLCDSAHNYDGLQAAMVGLKDISYKQLHMVIGMVNDKDLSKLLELFPKNAKYYFTKPDIPRGLDVEELKKQAERLGLNGRAFTSVQNALLAAKRNANADDLVYVGGSTFVVAEVL